MTPHEIRDALIAAYGGKDSASDLARRYGVTKNVVIGAWCRARDWGQVVRAHRAAKPVEVVKPEPTVEVRTVNGVPISLPRLRFLEAAE